MKFRTSIIGVGLLLCGLQLYAQLADAGANTAAQGKPNHKPTFTITTFDPPGSTLTFPDSINPAGAITGQYRDGNFAAHGFLRERDGTFTSFDIPNADPFLNFPSAINPAGAITGYYGESPQREHGFLRAPDGTLTTFDAPGSTFTEPLSINPAGTITGTYEEGGQGFNAHGFLRAPDGTFTTFDVPDSTITVGVAINPAGAITGTYENPNFPPHVRARTKIFIVHADNLLNFTIGRNRSAITRRRLRRVSQPPNGHSASCAGCRRHAFREAKGAHP